MVGSCGGSAGYHGERVRGAILFYEFKESNRPRSGRNGPGLSGAALERVARPRPVAQTGRLQALEDHDATAESRRLVHLHHRHGSLGTRNLRFRTQGPLHPATLLLAGADGRAPIRPAPGTLRAPALVVA